MLVGSCPASGLCGASAGAVLAAPLCPVPFGPCGRSCRRALCPGGAGRRQQHPQQHPRLFKAWNARSRGPGQAPPPLRGLAAFMALLCIWVPWRRFCARLVSHGDVLGLAGSPGTPPAPGEPGCCWGCAGQHRAWAFPGVLGRRDQHGSSSAAAQGARGAPCPGPLCPSPCSAEGSGGSRGRFWRLEGCPCAARPGRCLLRGSVLAGRPGPCAGPAGWREVPRRGEAALMAGECGCMRAGRAGPCPCSGACCCLPLPVGAAPAGPAAAFPERQPGLSAGLASLSLTWLLHGTGRAPSGSSFERPFCAQWCGQLGIPAAGTSLLMQDHCLVQGLVFATVAHAGGRSSGSDLSRCCQPCGSWQEPLALHGSHWVQSHREHHSLPAWYLHNPCTHQPCVLLGTARCEKAVLKSAQ